MRATTKNLNIKINHKIESGILKPFNFIIEKSKNNTVKNLWDNIQHLDMFFDDNLNAKYFEKEGIIDFADSDGTIIFFVTN